MTDAPRFKFPKPTPRKTLRAEKKRTHKEATDAIHGAVLLRSRGACEAPNCGTRSFVLQMDHWLGGSGRRRTLQSIETCWMLCRPCHDARTRDGQTKYWNHYFAIHCANHGYPFTPHIEKPPFSPRRFREVAP